jgi:hypothetical protein
MFFPIVANIQHLICSIFIRFSINRDRAILANQRLGLVYKVLQGVSVEKHGGQCFHCESTCCIWCSVEICSGLLMYM